MERIKIDKENKCLLLDGFPDLGEQITIKKFGTMPARLVIVPGHKVMNDQQIATVVKDGMITDSAALEMFLAHTTQPEIMFINLDDGYYEYHPPKGS